jgi:hypothetical protein
MDSRCALAVAALVMAGFHGIAEAAPGVAPTGTNVTVCVVASPALTERLRWSQSVLPEVNAIWERYGVHVRHVSRYDDSCNRCVVVKSDREAGPNELLADAALAWVPFVEGRARRVVYVRISRIARIAGTIGKKDAAFTSLLTEKLLARSLAHELGHILLNDRDHVEHGLMRARYRARDLLSEPAIYTLSASQRTRLAGNLFGVDAAVMR